jgi:hypothetical protein
MVTVYDLRTVIMAILRINDGKRFVESAGTPLP